MSERILPVTGEEIFTALLQDPKFRLAHDEIKQWFRGYVTKIPDILTDDQLKAPLTLQGLFEAKITFSKYVLDNWTEAGDSSDWLKSMMKAAVEMFEEALPSLHQQLEEAGVSESDVILSERVGLWPPTAALYTEGKLTMAELLRTQPGVLLANS